MVLLTDEQKKQNKQNSNKNYYEKTKQRVLEQKKQKIECKFCKSLVSKNDINRHYKTIKCRKHQDFIDLDLD
tara:strand:+ start:7918 stop:8133 length:216 start_codon:yes stop_codon:yes gene_type:complete